MAYKANMFNCAELEYLERLRRDGLVRLTDIGVYELNTQVKSRDNRLQDVPTRDLVNELAKREGVDEYIVNPNGIWRLGVDNGCNDGSVNGTGPARILVVTD